MGQIFPKSKYRFFHCDKFWLYGNIIDSTVRNSFIHNTFEDDALFKQISFFLNNKSTYVDVGANYGLHAMGVISLNQKKEIKTHLIEPNSDCISCLKKTVKRNSLDNVYLHEIALGEKNGSVTFQYNRNFSVTGSVSTRFFNQRQDLQKPKTWKSYSVSKITLDQWVNENALRSVKVMKLDTSGYDWNIYCGGQKTFKSGLINVIFFDLLKEQLLLHGTKISSVIKFLLDNEYHLYHSMGQNKEKRHIFNIGNQNRIYYPMNVKKMLEKENCVNSYKHVHGMAVHSSYFNDINVTK